MRYVIGRNRKGRASLMHELNLRHRDLTLCGLDVQGGSRAYLDHPIIEVLCLRCMKSRARLDRQGM